MDLELYQRQGCPSCRRIRAWLGANGVDYTVRNVPKLGSERNGLMTLADTRTVPVLRDGEDVIRGEEAILAHLREHHAPSGFGDPAYGLTRNVGTHDMDTVRAAVDEALAGEGFGVLTEIDVRATMRKKLDVDHPPYLILGACNPPLAHRALTEEPAVGLLLPCNVVVAQQPDGTVVVSAIDPAKMLGIVGRDDLGPLASEVRSALARAVAAVRLP